MSISISHVAIKFYHELFMWTVHLVESELYNAQTYNITLH